MEKADEGSKPKSLHPRATLTVLVRCPTCGASRKVGPGEPQPFCDPCGMPMLAERAEAS